MVLTYVVVLNSIMKVTKERLPGPGSHCTECPCSYNGARSLDTQACGPTTVTCDTAVQPPAKKGNAGYVQGIERKAAGTFSQIKNPA